MQLFRAFPPPFIGRANSENDFVENCCHDCLHLRCLSQYLTHVMQQTINVKRML